MALRRRDVLFAGSNSGGDRWAKAAKVSLAFASGKLPEGVLALLINTAKLYETDPQTYLAAVLGRIVSGRTKANGLGELLPSAWKAAQASQGAVAV